ncbi:hypothetical protein IQ06DRAFT_33806 [Phaeosphaeriaceae sp. SRC1lsM3a]|nr:hypothetical protein IQ06DRAFT_33806 [Stagonospora sp. SRC1lsM3a]
MSASALEGSRIIWFFAEVSKRTSNCLSCFCLFEGTEHRCSGYVSGSESDDRKFSAFTLFRVLFSYPTLLVCWTLARRSICMAMEFPTNQFTSIQSNFPSLSGRISTSTRSQDPYHSPQAQSKYINKYHHPSKSSSQNHLADPFLPTHPPTPTIQSATSAIAREHTALHGTHPGSAQPIPALPTRTRIGNARRRRGHRTVDPYIDCSKHIYISDVVIRLHE